MQNDVLKKLKEQKLLSDETSVDTQFVSIGSYALNRIASGRYNGGIPIGRITQFIGKSSTAKTVFLTHILKEAQKKEFYTALFDTEDAFSPEFARSLGIDPEKLIYANPPTMEDTFQAIENVIRQIREVDKDTPIVIGYDSIAVSPIKKQSEAENYDSDNMIGATKAKLCGQALQKLNPIIRSNKVALIVINQFREKVGILYGETKTAAAGGNALEFYLGLNFETQSNKTSDVLKDEDGFPIGIQGTVKNKKNKVTIPYLEAEFRLLFDKGLDPFYGLIPLLEKDKILSRAGAWYTVVKSGKKFQRKDFEELLLGTDPDFEPVRQALRE